MKRSVVAGVATGAVLLGVLGGGAAAWAAWTAQDQVAGNASAASVGIAQDGADAASRLAIQYNEGTDIYSAAGAVVVSNTGTRDAVYSLDVAVAGSSVANIKNAIYVGVRVVPGVVDCTPTSMPAHSLSGGSLTFESTSIPSAPATVGAGADVVLCVETWIDEDHIGSLGSTSIDLELVSQLQYSDRPGASDEWTVTADEVVSVHQSVVSQDLWLLFAYPVGRYWIDQAWVDDNGTIHKYGRLCKDGSYERPSRHTGITDCGDEWESQWRLVPVPGTDNSEWWIFNAINTYEQPTARAWTFTNMASPITNLAPNDSDPNQKWRLEGRGDGTYRIVAAHATDGAGHQVCLTSGGTANASNSLLIVPAMCDDGSDLQGFTINLNGHPLPSTYTEANGDPTYPNGYQLTCAGSSPNNRAFTWHKSDQYEGEVHYQLLFNDIVATTHENGYATEISAVNDKAWIQSYWAAHGTGLVTQVNAKIAQSITEFGQWITITETIPLWIVHIANGNNRIYCSNPTTTPASTTLTCNTSDLAFSTTSEFANWDAFRVVLGGHASNELSSSNTTWTASPASTATDAGWLQSWWSQYGDGQFQLELPVYIQQKIGDVGEWVTTTQTKTVWLVHFGTNNNRIYCSQPNFMPASNVLTCSGDYNYLTLNFATLTDPAFTAIDEFRVVFNGVAGSQTWTSSPASMGKSDAWLNTWWTANAGGAFATTLSVTVEQRIGSAPWVQITQPITMWMHRFASNDVRLFCTQPAPQVPVSAAITFSGDGINSWQVLWTQNTPYVTAAAYRVKLGSTVIGTMNAPSYSPQIGWNPASNQTLLQSMLGSQTVTVEQSIAGGTWTTYATRNVTVFYYAGNSWDVHYRVSW